MTNTLEYVVLTIVALLIGFYACAQLNELLLEAVNQVASMIAQ